MSLIGWVSRISLFCCHTVRISGGLRKKQCQWKKLLLVLMLLAAEKQWLKESMGF
jgi:hypothetical protein